MAPLSLFRLKKQHQRLVVAEPLSPASFFSPGDSPTTHTVDIILEPEPYPDPHPNPQTDQHEFLFPHDSGRSRDIEPPSLPVSALSLAHSISPGPPNLALRFSFDAEGSLGDSMQRYFLSSHHDHATSTPMRGPITPCQPVNLTGFDSTPIPISQQQQHQQQQPPNSHSHSRRSPHSTNFSHVVPDDRSFQDSPVLHPHVAAAADDVLDISPSASRIDLLNSSRSSNVPLPITPKQQQLPISTPELPKATLPASPRPPAPVTAPRKRAAPAPIKIPSGSMHAPKVIVEHAAEQSTLPTTATAGLPPTSAARASRQRSVEEIEHVVGQSEHARKNGLLNATTTTTARPRPAVPPSRKSITASAYFESDCALAPEYTLPASSAGDRLSVFAPPPPPGRADSATLPEDSPGWHARGFFDDGDIRHVPPVPTLPPVLRRTRTANAKGSGNETTQMLVVPKRESSLLPSAITAKLLPIALRQSDASSPSPAEAASSWTFSQLMSGYYPSVPQDAVEVDDSLECKSIRSDKLSHATTTSTDSEAETEITIAGRRATSSTVQPTSVSRRVSPPVAMTPAGILGLEKTVPPTAPSNVSRSTAAPPVLHPRNKTGETDAPDVRPLPREASSQPIRAAARSSEAPWRSPRRTDSLRPSPAVERLKASRDSALATFPPTPGAVLAHYLDLYTQTNVEEEQEQGEDKDGADGPASTGSSWFSTGASSMFGTSATGRSPYSLYQGTTPGSGQYSSSGVTPSKVSSTATASAAVTSPNEQLTSSSSSKSAHPHDGFGTFGGSRGHFRGRSVSDTNPASTFVPAFDRRPSLPESSTPSASATTYISSFLPSTAKLPETAFSLSSTEGDSSGVLPVTMMESSDTLSRSTEHVRPVRLALDTRPPLPFRDLPEGMFPHTPHSFSPGLPNLDKLLDGAAKLPVAAAPPPAVVAPELAPVRPRTTEPGGAPVLGGNLSRSFPSHRAHMSSLSSTSSFSRRDRTLPIGPRKPTIKRKGAETAEIPRPTTALTTTTTAESNAASRAGAAILPTPATTPPGQAGRRNPREGSFSISPPQTHSRTRTKSSASTLASASVIDKIGRPATPTFDTAQVQWRGLTLDAAKWVFSSQELHAMVGRAIRQSADPMSIRLLPIDLLDTDLPAALEDLEVRREEIKARYMYEVRRRTTLLRGLAASAEGTATPVSVLKYAEDLSECAVSCDRLSEELFMVSDQIAQIGRLRDGHSASALAMALRKINTSFLRASGEAAELRTQVEVLTAEREEAWAMAETVERELDELRAKVEQMEQETLEQQQQRQALQVVSSPLSRSNSTKGSLSRSTSRVSAAKKSSMRVSKASLRKSVRLSTASTMSWRFSTAVSKTPATSSPLFLVPPVPRLPHGSARSSYLADGQSPSPRGTPQALINAQNELLEMLGIPINEFKNGTFVPAHRRSHSATVLPWAKSPPASPLDSQSPVSPVPIPKAPPASKLFRSASIAEHARLSRRKKEIYSTVDMEMIYDGILDDPETLFAVLKN